MDAVSLKSQEQFLFRILAAADQRDSREYNIHTAVICVLVTSVVPCVQ